MSTVFEVKRGAKGKLTATLTTAEGAPQDLTGATVALFASRWRTGVQLLAGSAVTIEDGPAGEVSFVLPDTSAWPLGMHACEFEVSGLTPTPVRYPSGGYFWIHVIEQQGAA